MFELLEKGMETLHYKPKATETFNRFVLGSSAFRGQRIPRKHQLGDFLNSNEVFQQPSVWISP